MNGREVFKFAVRIMGDASTRVVEKAGLTSDDIDLFVPHQANIRIMESARLRLGIEPEKNERIRKQIRQYICCINTIKY